MSHEDAWLSTYNAALTGLYANAASFLAALQDDMPRRDPMAIAARMAVELHAAAKGAADAAHGELRS